MAAPSDDFDRGRKLGKYEIVTRLSIGGMAELFLAFLPGPGGFKKFLALKQILPDARRDDGFVKMFLDEARITAAFAHPNIGQVFDLGVDPRSKELYLAMEFIAGQNLHGLFARAVKQKLDVPLGFACRVMRDVCLALHYAHTFVEPGAAPNPVIHRDVSPKNVMVTYTGNVKVIDFGIAKARGRLARTQVGVVKGTSGYMSPEQVMDKPLDTRTDLFSVGVMLYELLSMQLLFDDPGPAGMIRVVEGEVEPLASKSPLLPKALSDVVMRCLSKRPEDRFQSARELARAIEHAHPLDDEEQVAAFVTQLFGDKLALTTSLLELARQESPDQRVADTALRLLADDLRKPATPQPPRDITQPHTVPVDLPSGETHSVELPTGEVPTPVGTPRDTMPTLPKVTSDSPWPLRLVVVLGLAVAGAGVAVFFFDSSLFVTDERLPWNRPAPARPAAAKPPPLDPSIAAQRERADRALGEATAAMQALEWDRAEALLRECRVGELPCPGATGARQTMQRERGNAALLDGVAAALERGDLVAAKTQLQAARETTLFAARHKQLEAQVTSWKPPVVKKALAGPVMMTAEQRRADAERLLESAQLILRDKQYGAARNAAEACVRVDPQFADCYRLLGTASAFIAAETDANYQPVVKNYQLYLKYADPNDPMVPKVKARLAEIEDLLSKQ